MPDLSKTTRMPALFAGHGSPMNAVEDNEFSRAWITLGQSLPTPRAILSISAHWQTQGIAITGERQPKTIYDFFGFPKLLYEVQYPATGSAELIEMVQQAIPAAKTSLDWGLDHGTWSVLCRVFPKADIPVVQLSLDETLSPEQHYQLGKALRPLRDQGILIFGSGNVVHNLRIIQWGDTAFDWAIEFDAKVKQAIQTRNHASIYHYEKMGRIASLAVPTNEHFLPLLYVLAVQDKDETPVFFTEKVTQGSISMRGVRFG